MSILGETPVIMKLTDEPQPSKHRATAYAVPPIPAARKPAPVDRIDIVEQWGHQSFPASDPPANW
jgi:hypothetical protein